MSLKDLVIALFKGMKEMQKEFDEILNSKKPCKHTRTVCINEEGNAGVFCADCGKQLEKEC